MRQYRELEARHVLEKSDFPRGASKTTALGTKHVGGDRAERSPRKGAERIGLKLKGGGQGSVTPPRSGETFPSEKFLENLTGRGPGKAFPGGGAGGRPPAQGRRESFAYKTNP